ncbi:MAG: vitamin K epoxide reductase family protein [Chloroflexi bacterium]|nr:vitamin K epoxide reductase family protein [Chloroflexota bacterium]
MTLRAAFLALVVIGVFISGYLSYIKLTETAIICVEGSSFNCDSVTGSVYGKVAGIPIAYLGLATYLALGALVLLENRVSLLRNYGITLVFGITLFGFIYSMFLVYVQASILKAFCSWCLAHEVVMTLLFIVSGARLFKSLRA